MAEEVSDKSPDDLTWEEKAIIRQDERQAMYHRWKIFDEEQNGFMRTDIGILLFGPAELTDEKNPTLSHLYYKHYSETQQQTIETIHSQIRAKIPPPENVAFGFTFLTARVDGCEDIREFAILRFAKKSLSEIFFIEPSGRVYRDWQDFHDSNKLPRCTYVAPEGGIYKLEGTIRTYTSPEANKSFAQRHIDKVMTAAGVGIMGAGIFSVAPVALAATGVGISVYSTYQSVTNLYDRYNHSESIKPDNVEAISNHLTIATAGLTGASSAALAYRQQIMKRLGKWAPTVLRAMNIGVLSLDAFGVLFSAYVFKEKCHTGDWTFMDTFNLALQVYLLHGQISNTIEIHRMLSSSSTAAPRRLTKTQKRNLQKRRAKAAKRGQVLSANTVVVTDANCDTFQSMKLMAQCMGCNLVAFLRRHYPREEVIMEFLSDVRQLISNLWNGNIDCSEFFSNLRLHVGNLMQILTNDIETLRRYSFRFDVEPDVDVVGATYNGVQRVNNYEDDISDELDRMIQQIPGDLHEPSAPEHEDTESSIPVSEDGGITYMKPIDAKSILNAVKELISKCIVHPNSAMLLVFPEGVKYIRSVIVTQVLEKYEKLFSANMKILNDAEMVAETLSIFGVKIGNQFFPARAELEEILSEAVKQVELFIETAEYAIGIQDEKDVVPCEINPVISQISESIATIFELLVPPTMGCGLEKTLDMLEYVTDFYIGEKLVEFDQHRTTADKIFQVNVDVVGLAKTNQMLAKLGMYVDPVEIALKCANAELDDVQLGNLLEYYSGVTSVEPAAEDNTIDSPENARNSDFGDEFLITLTMNTCSVFMNKIKPLDCAADNPQRLLQKVVYFVMDRFARDTSNSIQQFQRLRSNLDVLGPAKYKMFLEKLKSCQKNRVILRRTSELLMAFGEDVVLEYFELFNDDDELGNVNLWQSSADEEGLQVKNTRDCCVDLPDLEFRDLAMSLFHVHIDPNFSVEKSEHKNSVYLKSEQYIVTFSLDEESGSWLVILADRRVELCED